MQSLFKTNTLAAGYSKRSTARQAPAFTDMLANLLMKHLDEHSCVLAEERYCTNTLLPQDYQVLSEMLK